MSIEYENTAIYKIKEGLRFARNGQLEYAHISFNEAYILTQDQKVMTIIYKNIGILYCRQGDYQKSEWNFKKAIDTAMICFGEGNRITTNQNISLGTLYLRQQKLEEAEEVLLKCDLSSYQNESGFYHPDAITLLNILGGLRLCQSKYDLSEQYYKQALTIITMLKTEQGKHTARIKGNLAFIYSLQGKYDIAYPLALEAIEISNSLCEYDPLDRAMLHHTFAIICTTRNYYIEAEKSARQALSVRETILTSEHLTTIISRITLVQILVCQKKYSDAELYLQQIYSFKPEKYQSNCVQILGMLRKLVSQYENHQKIDEARRLCIVALYICDQKFGTKKYSLSFLKELSKFSVKQCLFPQAEKYMKRLLQIYESVSESEQQNTAIIYNDIGRICYQQGHLDRAEKYYRMAIAKCEDAYGSKHPTMLLILNNLATLYYSQQKKWYAGILYERIYDVRKETLGLEHNDTIRAYDNLLKTYSKFVEE